MSKHLTMGCALQLVLAMSSCSCADDGRELNALASELERGSCPQLEADVTALAPHVQAPGVAARLDSRARKPRLARAGFADFDHRRIDYESQFRIASTTKTFVAVVILQLVEEGRLALDDSVEKWLPGVVQGHGHDGNAITIKQLLRHESGIENYLATPHLSGLLSSAQDFEAHRYDTFTLAELVAYAIQEPPLFAPGTRFSYSNTNYLLLGMIIEATTHEPWGTQVVERIVEPLGLQRTRVPGHSPNLSTPYLPGWNRFGDETTYTDVTQNSLISGADAGVVSDLHDLSTFFLALMDGRLLSEPMLAAMKQTVPIDQPRFPQGRYGLGLQWAPLSCGGGYYHHAGDTLGYSVATGVLEDSSKSIVVVVNGALGDEAGERAAASLVDHALCEQRTQRAPDAGLNNRAR